MDYNNWYEYYNVPAAFSKLSDSNEAHAEIQRRHIVKFRDFLQQLMQFSPKVAQKDVRLLVRKLLMEKIDPEAFINVLKQLVPVNPKPRVALVLKKYVPLLREQLLSKELVLKGVELQIPSKNLLKGKLSTSLVKNFPSCTFIQCFRKKSKKSNSVTNTLNATTSCLETSAENSPYTNASAVRTLQAIYHLY